MKLVGCNSNPWFLESAGTEKQGEFEQFSVAKQSSCDLLHPSIPQGYSTAARRRKEQTMSEATTALDNLQLHEKDTGSADVQVARLSYRILHLTEHLGMHKKDHSTRRGLLKLVARRRKLLDYLARTENDRYQKVIKALGLRR